MTTKMLFSKIVLIVLVCTTMLLWIIIPELSSNSSIVLFGMYTLLLIISFVAKQQWIAVLLIFCAISLPIAEIVNWTVYVDWSFTLEQINKKNLVFSFMEKATYFIVLIIVPVGSYMVGNVIRLHRMQEISN